MTLACQSSGKLLALTLEASGDARRSQAGRIVYHREPHGLLVSPAHVISDSITADGRYVLHLRVASVWGRQRSACRWAPAMSVRGDATNVN